MIIGQYSDSKLDKQKIKKKSLKCLDIQFSSRVLPVADYTVKVFCKFILKTLISVKLLRT